MEPLTPDALLTALSRHVGAASGVPVGQLVYEATGEAPTPSLERECRTVIEQLRRSGTHICAHPRTGYFLAETADELNSTCEFLYSRAMTSLAQVAGMRRVSLPDLRGQLRMPLELTGETHDTDRH